MKKNIGLGIIIITLAVMMLLNSFGYIQGISVGRLIISLFLLWIFITSLFRLRFSGIFIPAGIAVLMYSNELGLPNLDSVMIIGASIFLSVGFSIIFGKYTKRDYCNHNHYNYTYHNRTGQDPRFRPGAFQNDRRANMGEDQSEDNVFDNESNRNYSYEKSNYSGQYKREPVEDYVEEPIEDDVIFYRSSFSSATRFIKSNNLVEANFVNELGSLDIYLDQVELSEDGAKINVNCRLGAIKIFIPRDFNVINNVDVTLGNVNSPDYDVLNKDKDNTITLEGNVTLGDINIVRI